MASSAAALHQRDQLTTDVSAQSGPATADCISTADGRLTSVVLAQIPTPTTDSPILGGGLFLLALFLVVPVAFAAFTAWLATERGRSWGVWFVLGFFFGPIALVALGFAPYGGAPRGDNVLAPGSLAAGLRSRFTRSEPTAGPEPAPIAEPPAPTADEPASAPVPVATAVPPRPRPTARSSDRPISPLLEIDVDGAVFHEQSNRAFGRGHAADGSTTYFVLSQERLHELSAELRESRPVRSLIPRDDVVPLESLPPELQR